VPFGRVTIILAVIAIGLLAYVYFVELARPAPSELEQRSPQLFKFDLADIRFIEVKTGDGQVRAERSDSGDWQLVNPGPGPADPVRLDAVGRQLGSLVAGRVVSEQPSDPALYGLDRPVLTATVGLKDGRQEQLVFGQTNPAGLSRYARRGDDPRVYLVANSLYDDLNRLVSQPPVATPTPTPSPTPEASPTPSPTATPTPGG
jgi:hypothetical protein